MDNVIIANDKCQAENPPLGKAEKHIVIKQILQSDWLITMVKYTACDAGSG